MSFVEELHEKYEEAESLMLDELHQILIMDTGRADLADVVERMNFQVASAQKIGIGNGLDNCKFVWDLILKTHQTYY